MLLFVLGGAYVCGSHQNGCVLRHRAGTHFLQNKLQSYIPGVVLCVCFLFRFLARTVLTVCSSSSSSSSSLGLTAFWESLRYYFDVHNRFVLHKLKALLVPYTHKKWGRIKADRKWTVGFMDRRCTHTHTHTQR